MVAVVAALTLFPGLGSYGFWEPYEIRFADKARQRLEAQAVQDAPSAGAQPAKAKTRPKPQKDPAKQTSPDLTERAIARGIKHVDASEFGARLPLA